jgi:hypothetical protein
MKVWKKPPVSLAWLGATNSTLKRGYMLLATRNNSAEAANEARKFYKEPKGFGKNEEMKGWSDFV